MKPAGWFFLIAAVVATVATWRSVETVGHKIAMAAAQPCSSCDARHKARMKQRKEAAEPHEHLQSRN